MSKDKNSPGKGEGEGREEYCGRSVAYAQTNGRQLGVLLLNVKGENCQEVRLEGLRWACKALHTTPKRLGFVLWVLEPVERVGSHS